jgi:hypothetical protein
MRGAIEMLDTQNDLPKKTHAAVVELLILRISPMARRT